MRRRPKVDDATSLPLELAHYDAQDWGNDRHAPCRYYEARRRWADEHPEFDEPVGRQWWHLAPRRYLIEPGPHEAACSGTDHMFNHRGEVLL